MTIPEAAAYFKTTERTVSDWRKKGAPVESIAALTTWLESNLRHTTIDTQAVIDRRRKVESLAKDFVRAYILICEAFPGLPQSDFEVVIKAGLHEINHHVENLILTLRPDGAIDPKEREIFERIQAEPWPLTGNETETTTQKKKAP